jgi:putative SOS response-associated peptidase YedK
MCERFTNMSTWQELAALYRVTDEITAAGSPWMGKVNIAPASQAPMVYSPGGRRTLRLARWSLIPSWAKAIPKYALHTVRAEEAPEKASFWGAWKAGRRCIVPANSFFAWTMPDTGQRSQKQAYAIGLADKGVMNLAGLWEEWRPKNGPPVISCAIITTASNAVVAPIHPRMPAILDEGSLAAWLGEDALAPEEAQALLKPFTHERMTAWRVSDAVGQAKNQAPEILDPL